MQIKNEVNESVFLMSDFNYERTHNRYWKVDKMMAFGGDNFKELCEKLNLTGKKALTVCGSGDQAIELVGQGFTEIDVFDINLISRHMLNLKIAAIMALNYEEFMLFSKVLFKDYELFQKVIPFLNCETKEYFDLLFKMKNRNYIYMNLLTHKYIGDPELIKANKNNFSIYSCREFYMIKESLLKTQIKFNQRNLLEAQLLEDNYDFIYFSNILLFGNVDIEHFKKAILPSYIEHLNSTGILVFYYMHYFANERDLSATHPLLVTKNIFTQNHNISIAEKFQDLTNLEIAVEPSGFGWGTGNKDVILALKKENK